MPEPTWYPRVAKDAAEVAELEGAFPPQPVLPKLKGLSPTAFAAVAFDCVCQIIDSAPRLTDALKQLFQDAHEELQYRVDKRIAFDRWVKVQIGAAEEAAAFYKLKAHDLRQMHVNFKTRVKADLEAAPDVEFRGTLGKVWLQRPSKRRLILTVPDKDLTLETVTTFNIPMRYLKTVTTVSTHLDTNLVREDLANGKVLEWAGLAPEKGVRFPAGPADKCLKEYGDE